MSEEIDHIVFFSGGISSFFTAKRVAEKYGKERTRLLFTDTLYEHEDLYEFLKEGAEHLDCELIWITEGRNPWEVFRDERFLGNSRFDPCSKILKRLPAQRWVKKNYPDPESCRLYLGLNHDEEHRLTRSKRYWLPYQVESPLMEPPFLGKDDMISQLRELGILVPELYEVGFPHNNCGGFCIKAGQAHFRNLLRVFPEKYKECEEKEQEMRDLLGRDVTILREQVKGEKRTLTLKVLRERELKDCDLFDWGGCGCFGEIPDDEDMMNQKEEDDQ